MNQIKIKETYSEEETLLWAKQLGKDSKPGDVYVLDGDLGCGKTVISKGFGLGLGILEPIVSPTFTILQEYRSGRLPFYHMDVYRIVDIDEMEEIGYDDIFYGEGVSLIEWGKLIKEILPSHYYQIRIEKDLTKGTEYRKITLESRGK